MESMSPADYAAINNSNDGFGMGGAWFAWIVLFALQARVQSLELQQALCGIPRTSPYGYGIYAYPTCGGAYTCSNGAF